MNNKHKLKLIVCIVLIAVLSIQSFSARKRRASAAAPAYPVDAVIAAPGEALDEKAKKQLDYFIQIAKSMDILNRIDLFKPYNRQLTGRISSLMVQAAALEPDPCGRQYLTALGGSITGDMFYTRNPGWTTLENNRLEIVFIPDEKRQAQVMLLKRLLPFDDFRFNFSRMDPAERLNHLETGNIDAGGTAILNTYIYMNDQPHTFKVEQLLRRFAEIRDNLPYKKRLRVPYPGQPPEIKIANLVYSDATTRASIILPRPEWFYRMENTRFKIVIFKNLLEAYVQCVLDPLSQKLLLPSPNVPSPGVDAYLSLMVLNKISRHMGPMFKINIVGQVPLRTNYDDEEERLLEEQLRREKLMKQPGKKKRELWLLRDEMDEKRYIAGEHLKTQAVTLHNIYTLISEGLIQPHDANELYVAFVVSMADRMRRNAKHPQRMGDVVLFNFLHKNGAIIYNINNSQLSVQLDLMPIVAKELAQRVLDKFISIGGLTREYNKEGPELHAISQLLAGIPKKLKARYLIAK